MQLVILSNRGARYIHDTIASIREHVTGWDRITIVDDSGDTDHRASIAEHGDVVPVADEPAGYNTAMRTVTSIMDGEHVTFWEEDFHAVTDINLTDLAEILDARPHLAQVALLRQPWYANEIQHGGVLEALQAQGTQFTHVDGVIEHRAFFTGNPSVWRRNVYEAGWPAGAWSENRKRDELRAAGYRFGMIPGVKVHHVGERTGFDY